jgi:hypothetical protein
MQSIASRANHVEDAQGSSAVPGAVHRRHSSFDRLDTLAGWAAGLGYSGVQVPTSAPHLFDLAEAARSQAYCDDLAGMLAGHGVQITELSTHLQGQLVAVHPAYDSLFDGFAPRTSAATRPPARPGRWSSCCWRRRPASAWG